MMHPPFHVSHGGVNRRVKKMRDPNGTHGPKKRKKGTWREAKFPLSIAMVPKGGFEPQRVSPPPPQDGVSASYITSARIDDRPWHELSETSAGAGRIRQA